MPDSEEPKPRMTFWGPRVETIPQGFKERLKKLEAQKAAAQPEPASEPVKRKYTRHTEE